MKQELLHVTKSLSSILSRVFSSIFICASNSFRACLVAIMIIAGMVGAVQQAQAKKVYITCAQSGHGLGVYYWDGGTGNTWPGMISTSVTPLGGTDGGTGGFYSQNINNCTKYIVSNNSDEKKTNDLPISTDAIWGIFDSIQANKSAELWTILMTSSTMNTTGIVKFASGGFSGGWDGKVNTTLNSGKFELTQAYTSGNGIDVYIDSTKFLYIKPADFGSPETATYKFTWDPTTGAMTAASTSCTTPTSGFAASANPSTVYISNTAYAEVTLSTSQTADAYLWECVSHPSYGIYNTPTIVSSTASSTTVQLPIEGTYTFRVGAKCADEAYMYSETVTVTANLNLWMKGPLYQNTWGDPTNVAWSISNNVRTYTLNPAYYNTGAQPREFVLNAYETSDDGHHIHSSTTSSNNQLTLTGIEYWNNSNLRALESLFSEADKNLKLTVTHKGGVYYDITLSDLCTTPTATQYPMTNATQTYTGGSLSPTITPAAGAGTVSKVYYDNVEGTGKTNAGTYAIKVDVNAGATYCSATGISLDNFVINKADQAAISAINGVSGTLCTGVEYTLSITGGSGTGTVTYTKESGDATATITGNKITFTGSGTYKIKAVKAADTNYNESSATSDLTINAGSVGGTATATESSVCSGSGTTITLTGNTGTIQWQSSTNGTDYSNISGQTSSTLSTGNLTVKTWYRAKVTSGSCSANSSVATVDIYPTSVGGTATATASTVCSGSGTTISLSGNTGTIQWQSSTDGTNYSDISGQTSSTLSTGNLTVKTWYRAVVTSGSCSSANSSAATVDISPASVGGTATATASSVCSGSGTTITLTGNTGTIQWQSSTNGTDYSDISGATSSPLSTGNLTVKTWYRAKVTSGSCSANSSAAAVTIKTSPVLSAITGSATTTQYKPETYTASGSNLGTLTWAIVGAPAHANISATTGSSTVFKAKDGSYTLSVTATNDGCTDNETKGITVSTDSETCP